MYVSFFPDAVFAWGFLALLLAVLSVASYWDWRTLLVPKWLTIPLLAAGLLVNLLRGGWLGALERPVWLFGAHGIFVGALDGLLFALAGFALGFALYFVMWMLNVCGGGDVKLFAAVGAWIGPGLVVFLLAGTTVVVFLFAVGRIAWSMVVGQWRMRLDLLTAPVTTEHTGATRSRKRALSFSLPLAIATAFVLLWVFRIDLHLSAAQQPPSEAKVEAHVRHTR